MLTIRKTVKTTKWFPVEVVKFEWHGPLGGELQELRCTCCDVKLGNREWGGAWIVDGGIGRGARLCFECSQKAATVLSEETY